MLYVLTKSRAARFPLHRASPIHVSTIDHLPTLLPKESSDRFCADLLSSFKSLDKVSGGVCILFCVSACQWFIATHVDPWALRLSCPALPVSITAVCLTLCFLLLLSGAD